MLLAHGRVSRRLSPTPLHRGMGELSVIWGDGGSGVGVGVGVWVEFKVRVGVGLKVGVGV